MEPSKYSHFYLYAKGHYQRTEMLADLRRIVSEYSGTLLEHVNGYAVVSLLTDTVLEHMRAKHAATGSLNALFHDFQLILLGAGTGPLWLGRGIKQEPRPIETTCRACLDYLVRAAALDDNGVRLVQLAPANPNVLPLTLRSEANTKPQEPAAVESQAGQQ